MQNVLQIMSASWLMINLLAKNFIFMKLAMKNAVRQNQLSLPPLIIGFCIIVAMVKAIFQHPLWKNNTLPLAICLWSQPIVAIFIILIGKILGPIIGSVLLEIFRLSI